MGPPSSRSSAFPCGRPSITSKRTTSPRPFSAARCASVPPIIPAPMSAIFLRGMRLLPCQPRGFVASTYNVYARESRAGSYGRCAISTKPADVNRAASVSRFSPRPMLSHIGRRPTPARYLISPVLARGFDAGTQLLRHRLALGDQLIEGAAHHRITGVQAGAHLADGCDMLEQRIERSGEVARP